MIEGENIIKKLHIEIDTNSMAYGLKLKDDISLFLKEKIYPVLNNYFNSLSHKSETQIFRFDKISIDLTLDEFSKLEDIKPLIIKEIQKKINPSTLNELDSKNKVSIKKTKEEGFLIFLKDGRYPWWFDSQNIFRNSDLKSFFKHQDFIKKINVLLHQNSVQKRLIYQFNNSMLQTLISNVIKDTNQAKKETVSAPKILLNSKNREMFWTFIFTHINSKKQDHFLQDFKDVITSFYQKKHINKRGEKDFYTELITIINYTNNILKTKIGIANDQKNANHFIIKSNSFTSVLSLENAIKPSKMTPERKNSSLKNSDQINRHDTKKEIEKLLIEKLPTLIDKTLLNDLEEHTNNIEGLIIKNAGLILLHPFLKHFFVKHNICIENRLVLSKIDLAVHLLHYLACEKEKPYEHQLAFEKYLLNIPMDYPVNRHVNLSKKQKESCDELLQAVLTHWAVLKSNSTGMLRNEFLSREGKLTTSNDKHTLYIQRKTQDLLLDKLPWNMSLVKFPWKKRIVFVEW